MTEQAEADSQPAGEVQVQANDEPRRLTLDLAFQEGNVKDAVITGVVVDVRDSSGLVLRCPECDRVLQKGSCRVHGRMKGKPDLRTKAVIDDGTGAVLFVLDREQTERLAGLTLDQATAMVRDTMDSATVLEHVERTILGRIVEVRGQVVSDDFGFMLLGREAQFTADPPA